MKKTIYFLLFLITGFHSCVSDKLNDENYEITADLIDPKNPPIIEFSEKVFSLLS